MYATGCLCFLMFLMQSLCYAFYLCLIIFNLGLCLIIWNCMCCLMPVSLLTRSANRSNRFATSVRLVVITGQTGCCVTYCPFSFSCMPSHVICITYYCMALSHLFAPHKLRDIGKFHVSYEYVQMACLGHFRYFKW
jgi:hypothetical protein